MKKLCLIFFLFLVATNAEAKITIFACEPEWAAVARQITGDKAAIKVAITADQNPRNVELKTALIALSRSASMIFCSGGDLEEKWLSVMINKGNNLKALTNDNSLLLAIKYAQKPNFFDKDEVVYVGKKQYLLNGSRVHLNPHNITAIAAEFTKRVKLLDPINANFYQNSYEDFLDKWQKSITEWEKRATALKGMPLITNDNSWNYLADWLGLKITTIWDQKTKAKPNALSMKNLVETMKASPPEAIIFARWEDKRLIFWLRDTTKTRVLLLPYTVSGLPNSSNLFKLFNSIINGLLTDCSSGVCKTLSAPETSTVKVQ